MKTTSRTMTSRSSALSKVQYLPLRTNASTYAMHKPKNNSSFHDDYEVLCSSSPEMVEKTFTFMEDALFEMLVEKEKSSPKWKDHLHDSLDLLKKARTALHSSFDIIKTQQKRIESLEALLTTDELTGIANQKGFSEAFVKELDRSSRNMSKGGLLVIIDLDNFQNINKTHGREAGDACLKKVADFLKANVRLMDMAARIGGDEFVLLMCNATKDTAIQRAQHIAWELNHLSLEWNDKKIDIRGSVGLKDYGSGDCSEGVFNLAEKIVSPDQEQSEGRHAQ